MLGKRCARNRNQAEPKAFPGSKSVENEDREAILDLEAVLGLARSRENGA